jgi:protein-disulfide isomerase
VDLGTSANRLLIAAVLCLLGAVTSGLLLLQHNGETEAAAAVSQICGLFFYLSLLVLLILGLLAPEVRDVAGAVVLVLTAIALLTDLGLLAIQAFAIKDFCKLCLLTYVLNIGVVFALAPFRAAVAMLRGLSTKVEGRLLLAGWVAGSLAVAAAVAGAQSTLSVRKSVRARAMIGLPTGPPTTAPAPVPTPAADAGTAYAAAASPVPAGNEAQHYKELAEKLQATLDDPKKLEDYFTAKAAADFDKAQVQSMDLTEVPSKGPATAPVQVVEYFDYLCPFCRQLAGALDAFMPQAGNRVIVYYKNYPLDMTCNPNMKQTMHAGACFLAMGGICANYQGKFANYQARVFGVEVKNPTAEDVIKLAGEAGLNGSAFEACLNDPRTKARLNAEIDEAKRVGVVATPTLFINGKKLARIQDFVPMVDKEAQKKGMAPLPANLR